MLKDLAVVGKQVEGPDTLKLFDFIPEIIGAFIRVFSSGKMRV